MPKSEKKPELWKAVGTSILCALGIYLALQFLGALLLQRQVVGEDSAPSLVWASAGIALLCGVLIMGRHCTTGRLLLGGGSALGFTLLLTLLSMTAGNPLADVARQLTGIGTSALAGGAIAALVSPKKGGKHNRRRR